MCPLVREREEIEGCCVFLHWYKVEGEGASCTAMGEGVVAACLLCWYREVRGVGCCLVKVRGGVCCCSGVILKSAVVGGGCVVSALFCMGLGISNLGIAIGKL